MLTKNRFLMNKSHVDIKYTFYLDVRNVRRQIFTSFVYENRSELLTFDIKDFAEVGHGN